MKLVMTLRTRDQADIIDAVLAFHLNVGVDYVIATDHRSQDGTVDILEEYARAGVLHLIREHGEEVRGREWRTRMARMAAVEHGADWTFSCDGDEFWWPRGSNLKEVLSATPKEFGVVLGLVRHFLPISARDGAFAERMTVRFSPAAPLNNPLSPYRPYEKVAHRGDPGVVVHRGNHHLHASRHAVLRRWYPIEVLHFPVRSAEQAKAKNLAWARVFGAQALGTHLTTARSEQRGDVDEYVTTFLLPEHIVQRGLAEGSLVEDVRLRDVLRELARTNGGPYVSTAERSDHHLPVMRRDLTSWVRDRQSVFDRRVLALVGSVDQLNRRIEALETLPDPSVKVVMTLLARDEVDVIETQLSYHLNAGVDFVIASDHESNDGTTEVLESHERDGHLHLIRRTGPLLESAWRTEMARLAATEYAADWVINTDADEFWIPWGGTLRELFAAVRPEYGVVWALTRHFVPRPDTEDDFVERMVVRLSQKAAINDPTSPYRPHAKAAHRAAADIVVRFGSHIAYSRSLQPLRDWYPADVLHFPFRSREQYERKGVRRAYGDKPLGQYVKASFASSAGRIASFFDTLAVDDGMLERGLRSGALVVDTRLRDAIRRIGAGRAPAAGRMSDADGSIRDRVQAIAEGGALRDADLVRVRRRLDELALRVVAVDSQVEVRPGRTAGA